MTAPVAPRATPRALEAVRTVRRAAGRRRRVLLVVLGAAVAGLAVLTALIGASYLISAPDFARILAGAEIPGATYIATTIRIPRILVGALAGVALGIAGAIFQSVLRNPIASPDIMGIAPGAAAAAVALIALRGLAAVPAGLGSGLALTGAAVIGGLATAAVIVALGGRGRAAGPRMILTGVGIALGLQSVTVFLLSRTRIENAQDALVWMSGSLAPADLDRVMVLGVAVALLLLAVRWFARDLNILELSDDVAAALGVRPRRTRLMLLLLAVLLAAVATGCTGPIVFVALASGPIARRLPGGSTLPAAGLVGAVLVLGADWIGANALPVTLPVGIVTGALGAPFLLWLIVSATRSGGRPA